MNKDKSSLKIIAERIVDSILEQSHFNKESLLKIIVPCLKVWLNKIEFRKTKVPEIDKILFDLKKVNFQKEFWCGKLREAIGQEKYDELCREINTHEQLLDLVLTNND